MIDRGDLIRALAAAGGPIAAATALGVNRKTVYRAMRRCGLTMPRPKRIPSGAALAGAYEQCGGIAHRLVQMAGVSDHKYVLRQLERYGLKSTPDAWAREHEERAA